MFKEVRGDVENVLLDMDGTLLDLSYDKYFWDEYLPYSFSVNNNVEIHTARMRLDLIGRKVTGSLDWYSTEYWTKSTGLKIDSLKREINHLIKYRKGAVDFLEKLKSSDKKIILVTNADHYCLLNKIEKTGLGVYFDKIYSSHDFNAPKESDLFWKRFFSVEPMSLDKTLFIDDDESVLETAYEYGIENLISIENPSSNKVENKISKFSSINDFDALSSLFTNNSS